MRSRLLFLLLLMVTLRVDLISAQLCIRDTDCATCQAKPGCSFCTDPARGCMVSSGLGPQLCSVPYMYEPASCDPNSWDPASSMTTGGSTVATVTTIVPTVTTVTISDVGSTTTSVSVSGFGSSTTTSVAMMTVPPTSVPSPFASVAAQASSSATTSPPLAAVRLNESRLPFYILAGVAGALALALIVGRVAFVCRKKRRRRSLSTVKNGGGAGAHARHGDVSLRQAADSGVFGSVFGRRHTGSRPSSTRGASVRGASVRGASVRGDDHVRTSDTRSVRRGSSASRLNRRRSRQHVLSSVRTSASSAPPQQGLLVSSGGNYSNAQIGLLVDPASAPTASGSTRRPSPITGGYAPVPLSYALAPEPPAVWPSSVGLPPAPPAPGAPDQFNEVAVASILARMAPPPVNMAPAAGPADVGALFDQTYSPLPRHYQRATTPSNVAVTRERMVTTETVAAASLPESLVPAGEQGAVVRDDSFSTSDSSLDAPNEMVVQPAPRQSEYDDESLYSDDSAAAFAGRLPTLEDA